MDFDAHASKRQRTAQGAQVTDQDSLEERHRPQPSPVVHVRGLSESAYESDLITAVSQFGPVSTVLVLPRKRQALIEFENVNAASLCVDYAAINTMRICGQAAYFNYSTSQKIEKKLNEEEPNKIILFTIINPQYAITTEVMHTICSPHGNVLRIVIFKKYGVQAMVEFDSIDAARRAKAALHGCDIYSSCCTLKCEFAKQTILNVARNDSESWDYTLTHNNGPPRDNKQRTLLADPRYSQAPTSYNEWGGDPYKRPPNMGHPEFHNGSGHPPESFDPSGAPYRSDPSMFNPYAMPGYHDAGADMVFGGVQQSCVLMVYGLTAGKWNAEKLFSLFCLYGNVMKVKFLKSKENSAMIQMGDKLACERALRNLNNIVVFGNKIQLSFSKQPFLQDVAQPFELHDGTASFVDYQNTRNNRYKNQQDASKNREQPPTPIVHYFNCPPSLTEESLQQLFVEKGATAPAKIMIFPSKTERSSSGLCEWASIQEAAEALIHCNHSELPSGGKLPYIMKLCFSPSAIGSKGRALNNTNTNMTDMTEAF